MGKIKKFEEFIENVNERYSVEDNLHRLDEMAKIAEELKESCGDIYFPEADTNNKCQTYALSYEEMVNYFMNDIVQVNQNIEEYNKYNEENQTGIAPLQKYNTTKKYIDFNNDKEYAGKEDF